MSLFKKERNKAIVNFIDIDNGSTRLASSGELNGEAGQRIVYDSQAQINSIEQRGYVLEKNNFNPNGETPFFGKQTEYVISFKHRKIAITHPDEKSGITPADLKKVGQQIVHYDGAANRTPQDSVNQVVFRRTVLVDQVTGQKMMQPWQPAEQNFLIVSTPEIPGYIARHAYVGGESVTPADCNRNYEVTYEINHVPSSNQQKVEIKYVDLGNDNEEITTDTLVGEPNAVVNYDPQETVAKLKQQGYLLINNGYNPNQEIQFFSNNDDYVPTFIMTMKRSVVLVDTDHPTKLIPKREYAKQIQLIVSYSGAGELTPPDNIQTINLTRKLQINEASGEIIKSSPWQADQEKFNDVQVPLIPGFHADKKMIAGMKSKISIEKVVKYQANGRIIPIDVEGNEIPNAKQPIYKTDGYDPTKVEASIILPAIKGYSCDLITITPKDPGKNTKVVYQPVKQDDNVLVIKVGQQKAKKTNTEKKTKVEPKAQPQTRTKSQKQPIQMAVVNFIDLDQNGRQLTSSGILKGYAGSSINALYSTKIPLKIIKQAGYHIVFNNFDIPDTVQKFGNQPSIVQIFTIGLSRK